MALGSPESDDSSSKGALASGIPASNVPVSVDPGLDVLASSILASGFTTSGSPATGFPASGFSTNSTLSLMLCAGNQVLKEGVVWLADQVVPTGGVSRDSPSTG